MRVLIQQPRPKQLRRITRLKIISPAGNCRLSRHVQAESIGIAGVQIVQKIAPRMPPHPFRPDTGPKLGDIGRHQKIVWLGTIENSTKSSHLHMASTLPVPVAPDQNRK